MFYRFSSILYLVTFFVSASFAEQDQTIQAGTLPDRPSLSAYVAHALRVNPGLEAAYCQWQSELERIAQAQSLPNPQLSYAYFVEEVETRVGPQEQKIGVSQKFPWFGTLGLKGEAEAAKAKAAYEQFQAVRLRLIRAVKTAYYEYHYLGKSILITEENVELLKHAEGVAQSKYKAGSPLAPVIKAQVELGKLDDRLNSLRALREPVSAKLSYLLNRQANTPLPWPADVPFSPQAEAHEIHPNLTDNPELKKLDQLVNKEDNVISLAQKKRYPNMMLGVDYIETGASVMPNQSSSGKDPLLVMFALEIPLWQKSYKAAAAEATQRKAAVNQTLNNRRNALESDLQMILFQVNDAKRKVALFDNSLIPKAKESLEVTEESYQAGSSTFLDLIDAQRMLLEFELSLERARVDREISLSRLEEIIGGNEEGQLEKFKE